MTLLYIIMLQDEKGTRFESAISFEFMPLISLKHAVRIITQHAFFHTEKHFTMPREPLKLHRYNIFIAQGI